jgi:hypothetical protein
MSNKNIYTPYNSDLADLFISIKNEGKSEADEYIESESNAYLPQKRKNSKQPKDPSGKFYRTLPGFLVHYLENQGPTSESDLLEILVQHLPSLRNTCGSLYKNSPVRCLNGICKMPIFNIQDRVWSLNSEEVEKYRHHFLSRSKRTVKIPDSDKKGVRKSERVINILKGYSLQLAKDPRTETLVKDPLKEITGNEDITEAAKKIGFERLIGVLQAYAVVSKFYIHKLKKEDDSVQFKNIERDIFGIQSKLSKIEGHLVRYSSIASNSESNK